MLKLVSKWLRAGILEEDGRLVQPESGTPQGGVISPVLANVYLVERIRGMVRDLSHWTEEHAAQLGHIRLLVEHYPPSGCGSE